MDNAPLVGQKIFTTRMGQMKLKSLLVVGLLAVAAIGAVGAVQAADARLFVRHEVSDYGVWRKAFDAFAPTQKKLGVIGSAVYRSADNANDVTVIHDFHSVEKAKAFAASPELKAAMEKAGVKGAPQIWITTQSMK
jgi:ABC-type sugar transport system substrate-binding protein